MSWAAHEFENYLIQKEFSRKGWVRPAFLAIVAGTYLPDVFTKAFVYKAGDQAGQVHRGWPGLGFSHSFLFGVLLAVVVLWLTRSRAWAFGLLLGQWAHALSDCGDTAGTMPFFPFSTEPVSFGLWGFSAAVGRYGDAASYYSGPGLFWDLLWLTLMLTFAWQSLTAGYFREVIVPADPRPWSWMHRRLHLPEHALLMVYRGVFFYAAARVTAWFLFARFDARAPLDPSWGGPGWVDGIDISDAGPLEVVVRTTVGAALFSVVMLACWKLFIGRLWQRGLSPPPMTAEQVAVLLGSEPATPPAEQPAGAADPAAPSPLPVPASALALPGRLALLPGPSGVLPATQAMSNRPPGFAAGGT